MSLTDKEFIRLMTETNNIMAETNPFGPKRRATGLVLSGHTKYVGKLHFAI